MPPPNGRRSAEAAVIVSTSMLVAARLYTRAAAPLEAVALLVLTLLAVTVEARGWAEVGLARYTSRADTPAGLALGVVTLPWVHAALLLRDASLADEVPSAASLGLWSTLTAGAAIVVALCAASTRLAPPPAVTALLAAKLGTVAAAAAALCWHAVLVQATVHAGVAHAAARLLPRTFTAGEAVLVSGAVAWLLCTTCAVSFPAPASADPLEPLLRALLLGPLLVGVLAAPSLRTLATPTAAAVPPLPPLLLVARQRERQRAVRRALLRLAAVAVLVAAGGVQWLRAVGALEGEHPAAWVLRYTLHSAARSTLAAFWLTSLAGALPAVVLLHRRAPALPHILLRKLFHALAIVMFAPAFLLEPAFTRLAFAVAWSVLAALELARAARVPPLGAAVHRFMAPFADARDAGVLFVTHFSLLLGIATPLWLSASTDAGPRLSLASMAGLVTLGVGDTCASVVGFRLGRHRWFAHWPKSVEGTVAGILASFCCCVFFAQPGAEGRALVACVGAGCLEAFTAQLDNAFVPLHFFVLAVAA